MIAQSVRLLGLRLKSTIPAAVVIIGELRTAFPGNTAVRPQLLGQPRDFFVGQKPFFILVRQRVHQKGSA